MRPTVLLVIACLSAPRPASAQDTTRPDSAAGGPPPSLADSLRRTDARRDSAQAPVIDTASRAQADAEILQALKHRLIGDNSKETDNDEQE